MRRQHSSAAAPAVVLIVGTRPEAIKLAPVYRELATGGKLKPVLVSTGQHREMLDQALAAFGLRPDHDLNLMTGGQELEDLTARVVETVGKLLGSLRPAAVLVQGDTTTVLGSALAAFYQRIPMGHVEAGLRTYRLSEPWPEEMNRRLVDPISRWCFAPTGWSRSNLLAERISPAHVYVTGNTVVDALHWISEQVLQSVDLGELCARCNIPAAFRHRHLEPGSDRAAWILVTGHRRESFGQGLDNLCTSLLEICQRHPDIGILYPVHLNPCVQQPVRERLQNHPQITLVPPVAYEDMIYLMRSCQFIISDSGGIQEEAPSFGKPVLVTRNCTERPEGVAAGICTLVGTESKKIVAAANQLLEDRAEYKRRASVTNPYGDGRAAARICRILEEDLCPSDGNAPAGVDSTSDAMSSSLR